MYITLTVNSVRLAVDDNPTWTATVRHINIHVVTILSSRINLIVRSFQYLQYIGFLPQFCNSTKKSFSHKYPLARCVFPPSFCKETKTKLSLVWIHAQIKFGLKRKLLYEQIPVNVCNYMRVQSPRLFHSIILLCRKTSFISIYWCTRTRRGGSPPLATTTKLSLNTLYIYTLQNTRIGLYNICNTKKNKK